MNALAAGVVALIMLLLLLGYLWAMCKAAIVVLEWLEPTDQIPHRRSSYRSQQGAPGAERNP